MNFVPKSLYLFRHIQSNQVLCSMKQVLKPTQLFQLPFARKEQGTAPYGMRPARIRKDHWVPILKADFENDQVVTSVVSKLLNYRRYRSVQPLSKEFLAMPVSQRNRLLMQQQVPNTIADLADILRNKELSNGSVNIQWKDQTDSEYADWPESVKMDSKRITTTRGFRPSYPSSSSAIKSIDTTANA
ncbi:mitochondrial ribosomal protein subunit L67 [Schizosaccharomyces osmophilus]|uniref:Large ribosomal subunit protein mL67 n=1 Tax=Schizosaccharomyces osmophilus TaxID=2545709 RepID=A0AAE9WDF1_9SCHI|nr:mitochondrial ribosomal protein subunit L67 [Schizosaccharomyces osmophilus]WBW74160.1 mitochondrial ribosomal protein subunit L67 [Schizosaccharomyces osmophilus]